MTQKNEITAVKKKTNWNRILFMLSMMLIPIAHWAIFNVYCTGHSYIMSFQEDFTKKFTFENYRYFWREMTTSDGEIFLAIGNSLKFFALQFGLLIMNFLFAFFLYKKIFLYKTFRIIFYMPNILSGIVMTSVFMEFIKPMGPLGSICSGLGIQMPEVGLLAHEATALKTCFAYSIWVGISGDVLLFNGALARIPMEVIEAAKLDGCKPFKEAFGIILPLIWPTLNTMLIFMLCGILNGGGVVQLLTAGEAGTMTISYWCFKMLYGNGAYGGSGQYGILAAGSIILTGMTLPIILGVRWVMNKIPTVEF